MGKGICVLTNAASYSSAEAFETHRRPGLDIRRDEIVSSRDMALAHLDGVAPGRRRGVIAAEGDSFADIGAPVFDLLAPGQDRARAEGVLFLPSARWTPALQDRLVAELACAPPRPRRHCQPRSGGPARRRAVAQPGGAAADLGWIM